MRPLARVGRSSVGRLPFLRRKTSAAAKVCCTTLGEAAALVAKEPLLTRLRQTFHPWPEVAKVVPPQALHVQLGTFASTTGTVGALLSSVIGASLLAEPPKYSAEAQQKHGRGSEVHGHEIPLLARCFGWRLVERQRDDAYYVLLTTGFFCSVQVVMTSTMILTNLMAIPAELSGAFVTANALWLSLPAFLIAPTCVCATSALCIALESEFGVPSMQPLEVESIHFACRCASLLLLFFR